MENGNVTIPASQQEEFHVYTRDWVIAITFVTILYIVAHFIIRIFTKINDESDQVHLSVFLCTVCLAISLVAVLLLPITIISNEIIYNYPNYYYTQWLHRELIFGYLLIAGVRKIKLQEGNACGRWNLCTRHQREETRVYINFET